MTDLELMDLAKKRVRARKSFKQHFIVYAAVSVFLLAIYFLTTPFGYFWPIWPIMGWGLGVAIHGAGAYFALTTSCNDTDSVAAEYNRLKKEQATVTSASTIPQSSNGTRTLN